jgi:hypothetical protein
VERLSTERDRVPDETPLIKTSPENHDESSTEDPSEQSERLFS